TAIVILRFVQRVDPQLVVECGSGMSSFVIGRALQLKGSGKCIAFEDDRAYAERHREELREAGLSEYVEVYHTPIREHEISGKRWLWYDIDGVTIERNIDLLFVDGPKGKLQPMSRYPAVPVLKDRLTSGAVVLLDDAQRGDERKIAARWQEEFAPTHSEFIDGAKATHYLRF
ncbi:MAG: class I SAM-dependent methyltransferase, partial [Proteobacteria bacterium]